MLPFAEARLPEAASILQMKAGLAIALPVSSLCPVTPGGFVSTSRFPGGGIPGTWERGAAAVAGAGQ